MMHQASLCAQSSDYLLGGLSIWDASMVHDHVSNGVRVIGKN